MDVRLLSTGIEGWGGWLGDRILDKYRAFDEGIDD